MIDAVLRQILGGLIAEAGQQQMIGQKAEQLGEVVAPAEKQVVGEFMNDRRRHGRRGREFRIGISRPTDDDQRLPVSFGRGDQGVKP